MSTFSVVTKITYQYLMNKRKSDVAWMYMELLDRLELSGHQCKKIASMKMGPDRDWWLGELTEPIKGFPAETHCLHIKTPLKEVVLGVNRADMEQLAVLCQVVCGPINPHWLESMTKVLGGNR